MNLKRKDLLHSLRFNGKLDETGEQGYRAVSGACDSVSSLVSTDHVDQGSC